MPVGETLTLLATLANALQALRLSRPPANGGPAEGDTPSVDLLALDLVRAAETRIEHEYHAALRRFDWLLALSAGALLATAFLGVSEGAAADSPLFIAAVATFGVLAVLSIAVRHAFRLQVASLDELRLHSPAEFVERAHAAQSYDHAQLKRLGMGSDALLAVAALQVVLCAVWIAA
jgi:hypothetical protein